MTPFTTSRVTLLDRLREAFKMKRYLGRFHRDKALRGEIWEDMRAERLSIATAIHNLLAKRRKEEYGI